MDTRNQHPINLLSHLSEEGTRTLTKKEKDQRTLNTYEGLGYSEVQITDSTLQICHDEEQYHDEDMKGH